jgi:outer membrane protein assembly factor BamB
MMQKNLVRMLCSIWIGALMMSSLVWFCAAASAAELTQKWQFASCGNISSSPAVSTQAVYVGCNSGLVGGDRLYAVNMMDGSLLWEASIDASTLAFSSSPAVAADGTVYIGSAFKIVAFNATTGSRAWEYTTRNWIRSSPAIAPDGTIYVGSDDGSLYAINPDGTKKWEVALGGEIHSSPAIAADGTVYVGSTNDTLYAIDPNYPANPILWQTQFEGDVESSPALGADGTLYVGTGAFDYSLYAINTADGSKKWGFKATGSIKSSPAIGPDGTIYIGSKDAHLYAIDPLGNQKWALKLDLGGGFVDVDASPAVGADGTVYVGSRDKFFYAIDPAGTIKDSFQTGGSIYSSAAIGDDGTLYFGSDDNNLYALTSGQLGAASSPWPMFRHDARHTGLSAGGP